MTLSPPSITLQDDTSCFNCVISYAVSSPTAVLHAKHCIHFRHEQLLTTQEWSQNSVLLKFELKII